MKKIAIFAAVMVVGAGMALASTLNVPFFLDTSTNGTSGVSGFIGVKNASTNDQTVTVVYTAINASGDPEDQTVTFALGANQSISFTPVQSPPNEGAGSIVPSMTIETTGGNTSIAGSAQIIGTDTLAGRYQQINFNRLSDMVHVLLAE